MAALTSSTAAWRVATSWTGAAVQHEAIGAIVTKRKHLHSLASPFPCV